VANFLYKAVTSAGKPANGVVEAEDLARARDRLECRGLRVHSVVPAVLPKPRTRSFVSEERQSRAPLIIISVLVVLAGIGGAAWYLGWLRW
jgi:type II secretory pathway component PulF